MRMNNLNNTQSKTLGILGGGQLGRMSAMAAARLGIRCIIFTPEQNAPAAQVAAETIIAQYDDEAALKQFADKTDYISYEFENIPVKTIEYLSNLKPVYPKKNLLEISQDRVQEKSYLNSINIPTARWLAPQSPEDIVKTLQEWNTKSCILKTTRLGYDGKGQARIQSDTDINKTWESFNGAPIIMEEIIDFDCEISLIIARDIQGKTAIYGPMLNEHKNHILAKTHVPSQLPPSVEEKSIHLIKNLAEALDLTGILTLELFVTKDGQLLANEIAPRTHNSGHWSIDACAVSQFENHIRTTCALPVGAPSRHSDAEMLNLIGNDAAQTEHYLKQENTCLHLYGKQKIRAGRKMGHVTILKALTPAK